MAENHPRGASVLQPRFPGVPWVLIRGLLGIVAAAAALLATSMALAWAPTDAVQGDVYRIMYVHVPSAWLAYLAFVVVFLASIGWLWSRRPIFDAIAVSSADVGGHVKVLPLVAGFLSAEP